MKMPLTTLRLVTVLAAAALMLTACATFATSDHAITNSNHATTLTAADLWVKATDGEMTAAFGMLKNGTDHDITVLSATTSVSPMAELHETVQNDAGALMMQKIEGGFVVTAGDTFVLAPGGNHIMLMGVTQAIVAGDTVTITLTLDDGSTLVVDAAAKDYAGANENYKKGEMQMDQGDTEMGE